MIIYTVEVGLDNTKKKWNREALSQVYREIYIFDNNRRKINVS